MTKTAWATLAAVFLTAGALAFPIVAESELSEPTFEGRPLRSWLSQLEADPASTNVARVLRELGPAALRMVVQDLKAEDPIRWHASLAINLLGPAAAQAVPELVEMLASGSSVLDVAAAFHAIGESACTPESVRALAGLSLQRDPIAARVAVTTLGDWGKRATNAIPELLRGLRAQTAAGGMPRGARLQLPPDFGRALAVIGTDLREVLVELLAANVKTRGFGEGDVRRWCEGSSAAEALLADVASDHSVPLESRAAGIRHSLSPRLLPQVPALLEEPILRIPLAYYLHSLGPPGWALYPAVIEVLERPQPLDQVFCQSALAWMVDDGRTQPDVFVPMLLPLTFDERAPYDFGYRNRDATDLKEIPLASHAHWALFNITQDPAQLESALRHANWKVRNASASLFSGQNSLSTNAIQELVRCLQDTNAYVRLAAAVPLLRVPGHEGAVFSNFLAAIPNSELPASLRAAAVSLTGHFQQLHPERSTQAVAALGAATNDPDRTVREVAQRLLDWIIAHPVPSQGK